MAVIRMLMLEGVVVLLLVLLPHKNRQFFAGIYMVAAVVMALLILLWVFHLLWRRVMSPHSGCTSGSPTCAEDSVVHTAAVAGPEQELEVELVATGRLTRQCSNVGAAVSQIKQKQG